MCAILFGILMSAAALFAVQPPEFVLTSPAFAGDEPIPYRYTCDGDNISPALEWANAPAGVKSFALICDDPDAPNKTWVHWVVFNLPAGSKGLPQGVPNTDSVAGGGRQGITDFGDAGYGGPCPPNGTHRYYFKLYALSSMLTLKGNVTKVVLEKAMKEKIIGTATLMGTYKRK